MDGLSALISSENIVIATLALMLSFTLIALVAMYRDHRSDRKVAWQYIGALTDTVTKLDKVLAVLMDRK